MADDLTHLWARSDADREAVRAGCYFDLAAAERVRGFFEELLCHSKGQFAGKPFTLLSWQWQDVIAPLFGWRRADGTRRYRRATIWVPKKNGKSTLAAGLILYGLVADGEPGAEVYGAAADRQQASIIYNEVKAMVDQSPELAARLEPRETARRIDFPARHSWYAVLSKDARKTGHGVNAHLCVIDELHVVDRQLYDTMRYAGAARRQPLLVEISTAGDDKTSLGHERYTYAKRLIKGEIQDPETLAVVYEADAEGDWTEPAQWRKANPSLGATVSLSSFEGDFNEARNSSPATQASFKQLRLNLWQDAIHAWLPVEAWDACAGAMTPAELVEGVPCWGGLDLASKMDLCAWARVWRMPPGGEFDYYLALRFWAPEEADTRRQKANLALLRPWCLSGDITATPGNVADYDRIEADVKADYEAARLTAAAYDPWNAQATANHLTEAGLALVEFRQSIKTFNEPMKELERLVLSGRLRHDGNPVMRWMVAHTAARKDASGNVRPDKEHSGDHIDGVVAAIMGLGLAMVAPVTSDGGCELWE